MPTYVCLMNLTEQGIKNIKEGPQRLEAATKQIEAMGGRLIAFYMTMGQYDYVAIAEAPSDEVALTFLVGLGALGNLRTTTLKAFRPEEFGEILKKLP